MDDSQRSGASCQQRDSTLTMQRRRRIDVPSSGTHRMVTDRNRTGNEVLKPARQDAAMETIAGLLILIVIVAVVLGGLALGVLASSDALPPDDAPPYYD
jgi:hypothetical protein